jgi:hypothetical protein
VNVLCLDFSGARMTPSSTHHPLHSRLPTRSSSISSRPRSSSLDNTRSTFPDSTRLDLTRPDPTRLVRNPTAYVSVASSRALSSEDDHRRFHHHRFTTVTTITNRIKTR